jgi:hypothetical protein
MRKAYLAYTDAKAAYEDCIRIETAKAKARADAVFTKKETT